MHLSQKTNNVLYSVNRCLERLIPITTPLGVVLGFFLPGVFIHLRPYVPWLFGMMTFSGALKLKAAELGNAARDPFPILLFLFTSHILMPLAAMAASSLLFVNHDIIAGFVLLFSGPTAVSGFIWVSIFKGDKALGLALILLDTILAPIVVPGTVSILMGAKTAMNVSGIAVSLLFMVVIPTIIGVALNETSRGKIPAAICPGLDPFSKICLMLVIAANASVAAPGIRLADPVIWKTGFLCIVLTVSGFLLSKLNGLLGKCGREKTVSMVISGGLRNNSAVMTIAVTFFSEAVVLPTLLSIIFQQTIAAIMGKLLFEKKPE
jgi:predicted Na+-dependent transporter